MASYGVDIKISCLHMLQGHLHTWQDTDCFTMALALNNDPIIYYHMDATGSEGLMFHLFIS